MHAAAPAARATVHSSIQLAEQRPRLNAFGQRVAVAAMRAEDHVLAGEMSTDTGGDGFLPDVGVAGAVNQAALVRLGQAPRTGESEEHAAKQLQHAAG